MTLFGETRPLVVEVGCGDGEVLLELARAHPELGFLGIEVYRPGLGRLAMALAAEGLHHVRLATEDARQVMVRLAPASIDCLLTLFPDPWPKKRHHKRRLIDPDFVADVVSRLKPGAHWQLATDDADYAAAMRQVLGAHDALETTPNLPRPMSKYHRRALQLGLTVIERAYRKR
jgi:tRNA (guanine-N7-)-methyltransferase